MISVLGQNIKQIRTSKDITQKELSRKANVSQSTITEIENGTRQNLRGDTLSKIASALLVTTNELLGLEEDREYEISDLLDVIDVVFAKDSNLELDSKVLSDVELNLIKMQLQASVKMIRFQRGNK
ncbi:MAG: helix-turn-helix transcriptional regulator [Clostridium sp.]|nr:helix-turn-helix transcriptional regulator [Clostridium sp.]